jgi:calcineurin-like phosphoesterase family protein
MSLFTPVRHQLSSMWMSIKDDFQFSKFDLGWARTICAYLFNAEAPYRPAPGVFTLPESCSLAIVGDWGTGTDGANKVLEQILTYNTDYFMHLGDIYYSGTKNEVDRRFLEPLKAFKGRKFTLMGNHDAYSGGQGYYYAVDSIGQESCHFTLGNEYINFIALNTGWSDRKPINKQTVHLHDSEVEWAKAALSHKKNILLSHHQPFSGWQDVNNIVATQLGDLSRVASWFTGHEHRLVVYEPRGNIQRMRTVGAGGVPELTRADYFVSKVPCKPITYGDDMVRYKHSFAIMQINRENVTVRYLDEDNKLLFEESF